MKTVKRILIPLLLTALLLALLFLTACKDRAPESTGTAGAATEEEEPLRILTGVELETNETPVILLPQGTDDGSGSGNNGSGSSTPAATEPGGNTAPSSSLTPPWTGPLETPIITVRPSTTAPEVTDQP